MTIQAYYTQMNTGYFFIIYLANKKNQSKLVQHKKQSNIKNVVKRHDYSATS